jgi:hypothetical protein
MSPMLRLSGIFIASGHPTCSSFSLDFFFFGMYVMYINIYIYLHILMYKEKNHAHTFPRPPILGCHEMGFTCLDRAHSASSVRGVFRRSS